MFETVAILGVGLIGGSLARAMKERGLCGTVVGMGRGQANLRRALDLGVIDVAEQDLAAGVSHADLVVVATPVGGLGPLIRRVAPLVRTDTVVTDVGSVKQCVVETAAAVFREPVRFVGGHPIAGTEHSGVEASFASLFSDRRCILTPTSRTDPGALNRIRSLWEAVGSRVVLMDVEAHDRVMAFVSHLPHLVAYALVHAVVGAERSGDLLLPYTAGGFRDFTRIASSHPEMWRDICLSNRQAILEALGSFDSVLHRFEEMVAQGNGAGLEELFAESRSIRKGLGEETADGPMKGTT